MFLLTYLPPDPIVAHAITEWKRTPAMQAQDAYKWLYQATMGGEHAILNPEGPRRWLDDEWNRLGKPLKDERLIEKLMPDGSIIRVNLRPYKARGGDKRALLDAFVRSAKSFKPDMAKLKRVWKEWMASAPKPRSEWEAFDRRMREEGFPSVHHSSRYETAYEPAYRVLTGREWRRLEKRFKKAKKPNMIEGLHGSREGAKAQSGFAGLEGNSTEEWR